MRRAYREVERWRDGEMERGVDRQPCSQPAAKKRRRKRENENSKEAAPTQQTLPKPLTKPPRGEDMTKMNELIAQFEQLDSGELDSEPAALRVQRPVDMIKDVDQVSDQL